MFFSLAAVEVGTHLYWNLGGFVFHGQVLLITWLVIAIILSLTILGTLNLQQIPKGLQNFVESVFALKRRKWITGIPARNDVQTLRAEADIILTGAGTINEDNPSMNVRSKKIIANENFIQPERYVFSNSLKLNWSAPFFKLPGKKVVVTSKKSLPKLSRGIDDISLMSLKENSNSISSIDFIKRISKLNVNNILIEAGPRLLGSFGDYDLINEYIFYISPEKLGDKALHFYGGRKQLNFFDKKLFDIVEETNIGKDKKIILRKK